MSDKKKPGGDPREQEKPPIDPKKVVVTVEPKTKEIPKGTPRGAAEEIKRENKENTDRARKATGNDAGGATKEVRKAIEGAKPQGRDAQKQAAEEAAKQVGKKLNPNVFKGVKVDIPGEAPIQAPASEGAPAESKK